MLMLDEAARRIWPVLIVGAGPAGALAAYELTRRGVEVLLVDRATFPRWKVCGCCLNGNALATLERAGLGSLVARAGAIPLTAMRLSANHSSARFALSGSVALSREAFDTALVQEAQSVGAVFLPSTTATLTEPTAETRGVQLTNAHATVQVEAQVLLAADGLGGTLLSRSGENTAPATAGARIGLGAVSSAADDFYVPGTLYMTCGAGGYLGLVRLEDGRLDLAAAVDADCVRRYGGPSEAASYLLRNADWPIPTDLLSLRWRGTPALTRQARHLAAERVFVLGDAAGYVEPFTGEGMAWALAAGAAVAPFAERAITRWTPDLGRAWSARYRQVISRRQTACRLTAAVLRHSFLAGMVVAALASLPILATPFLRHLNRSSIP